MKDNPLISIVIPVYKVEKYIHECVNSVISQTYKNLDIILVDDGSPDNCPKICDDYQKQDSRIRVIHKANGGLSSARNAGIKIAKGEYIAFIDSDDYVSRTYVEQMYTTLSLSGAGLSVCTMVRDEKDLDEIVTQRFRVYSAHDAIKLVLDSEKITPSAYCKLYRTSTFTASDGVTYPEGLTCEDLAVVTQIMDKAGTIAQADSTKYFYRKAEVSIMRSKFSKSHLDYYIASSIVREYIAPRYPDLLKYLDRRDIGETVRILSLACKDRKANAQIISELAAKIRKRDVWNFMFSMWTIKRKAAMIVTAFMPKLAFRILEKI